MNRKFSISAAIKLLVVVFLIMVWVLPLCGVLVNSFRPFRDAASSGWWNALSEHRFTMDNYRRMSSQGKFLQGLKNSILITFPTVFFVLFFSSIGAYGLFFTSIPHRRGLYEFIAALIIIPAEITLAPTLVILKSVHLQNTFPGIWMSHTAATLPFGIFLIGAFMSGIPKELVYAAKIDGAGTFRTYFEIVLPLSASSMVSLAIFDFLWVWNDLLRALIVIPDSRYRPLTEYLLVIAPVRYGRAPMQEFS